MDYRIIPLIVSLLLFAFWLWMFLDMTNNDNLSSNSTAPLTLPPSTKFGWALAFIFLSLFAAVYYYFAEYRNKS